MRLMLTDEIWSRLEPVLKTFKIHFSKKIRKFIEAILWKFRTGIQWRDLPEFFGKYSSVFNKFNRWSKKEIWQKIFFSLRTDIDNEWNFLDATVVKAHQHSSGASGHQDQAIGKSVGGHTTKIHTLVDSHGNLIDFVLSGGEVHDSKIAPILVEISDAENLVADKAYHATNIRNQAAEKDINVVIPLKKNSVDKSNPGFDSHLYKLRHIVENFFAKIKHYRGISTRYDKLKKNYASALYLVNAYAWAKI